MNDADTRTIQPVDGRRVRLEDGTLLERAQAVEWSPYWQRRLDDGDIEISEQED